MGKSLDEDALQSCTALLSNNALNIVTRATLLTAILTLEPTQAERDWITMARDSRPFCRELNSLLFPSESEFPFLSTIHRVIAGEDLSYQSMQTAVAFLFEPHVPAYMKAAFLEAERLKRETAIENKACLDFFLKKASHVVVNTPVLIDISNGYDGFNRTPYLAPFIACSLAAMGFPTVIHGIDEVGPKKGVNSYKLLKQAGLTVDAGLEAVKMRLEDPSYGWAYCDQSQSFPGLHALKTLRIAMVKRPLIATIEKWLQPVKSTGKTFLVTGYTHPPYKHMTQAVIGRSGIYDGVLIVRGAEGSTQLSLDRRTPFVSLRESAVSEGYFSAQTVGLEQEDRLLPQPGITTDSILEMGLDALRGKKNLAYRTIMYQCLVLCREWALLDQKEAQRRIRSVLDSGKALAHWH